MYLQDDSDLPDPLVDGWNMIGKIYCGGEAILHVTLMHHGLKNHELLE